MTRGTCHAHSGSQTQKLQVSADGESRAIIKWEMCKILLSQINNSQGSHNHINISKIRPIHFVQVDGLKVARAIICV